jgi:hypothetical protein
VKTVPPCVAVTADHSGSGGLWQDVEGQNLREYVHASNHDNAAAAVSARRAYWLGVKNL